jgi:hypothetical protein
MSVAAIFLVMAALPTKIVCAISPQTELLNANNGEAQLYGKGSMNSILASLTPSGTWPRTPAHLGGEQINRHDVAINQMVKAYWETPSKKE